METYMTVGELAAYFKFTKQTIRRWVLNREVPYHKIKNSVRFRLTEIEKWAEENEQRKIKKEKSKEAEGIEKNSLLFTGDEG